MSLSALQRGIHFCSTNLVHFLQYLDPSFPPGRMGRVSNDLGTLSARFFPLRGALQQMMSSGVFGRTDAHPQRIST